MGLTLNWIKQHQDEFDEYFYDGLIFKTKIVRKQEVYKFESGQFYERTTTDNDFEQEYELITYEWLIKELEEAVLQDKQLIKFYNIIENEKIK